MTTGSMYAYNKEDAFVYVFDKESRDELAKRGFHMIVNDEQKDIYVFANQAEMSFALDSISHVKSNTISF